MNRNIPIDPFRAEGFAVEVRLHRREKGQAKRRLSTRIKAACCVVAVVPSLVFCPSAPPILASLSPSTFKEIG
jgi:hypothetical protein